MYEISQVKCVTINTAEWRELPLTLPIWRTSIVIGTQSPPNVRAWFVSIRSMGRGVSLASYYWIIIHVFSFTELFLVLIAFETSKDREQVAFFYFDYIRESQRRTHLTMVMLRFFNARSAVEHSLTYHAPESHYITIAISVVSSLPTDTLSVPLLPGYTLAIYTLNNLIYLFLKYSVNDRILTLFPLSMFTH